MRPSMLGLLAGGTVYVPSSAGPSARWQSKKSVSSNSRPSRKAVNSSCKYPRECPYVRPSGSDATSIEVGDRAHPRRKRNIQEAIPAGFMGHFVTVLGLSGPSGDGPIGSTLTMCLWGRSGTLAAAETKTRDVVKAGRTGKYMFVIFFAEWGNR
ncbi:hypothetical protein K474DRAFT_327017 [Panus rudis PR-1116 ss-1]|nr:hypothetical protein K474DRAFT_327017 [Panus rudis PR-1116 ss-1]